MGMFDYVKYSAPCPKCGTVLIGWQSKDAGCNLDTLEPKDVGYFYDFCDKCRVMIGATVEREFILKSIELKAEGDNA